VREEIEEETPKDSAAGQRLIPSGSLLILGVKRI